MPARRRWWRRGAAASGRGCAARRWGAVAVALRRTAVAVAVTTLPARPFRSVRGAGHIARHRLWHGRGVLAEADGLAGVDQRRLSLQRRADFDRAVEDAEGRLALVVDFDGVLRAADREQRARRLHDARLAADDLVEHRVDRSALQRQQDARLAPGQLDVGRAEDLELRAV